MLSILQATGWLLSLQIQLYIGLEKNAVHSPTTSTTFSCRASNFSFSLAACPNGELEFIFFLTLIKAGQKVLIK